MKKSIMFAGGILLSFCAKSQTLQTVTDNGNSTTKSIAIGSTKGDGAGNGAFLQLGHGLSGTNGSAYLMQLTNDGGLGHFVFNGSSWNEYFRFSGSGKLGIGTTAPSVDLEIVKADPTIRLNGTSSEGIQFYRSGVQSWNLTSLANSKDLSFYNNGGTNAYDLTIKHSNGNVGIGTITPGYKLDIKSDDYLGLRLTSNYPLIKFSSPLYNNGNGAEFWQNTEGGLYLNINGSKTVLYSNPDGNIGIGTYNTHNYKLAVAGNMIAESVKVALQGTWPDYIFKPGNKLLSLPQVEQYIQLNNHLPEIPSEAEVKKEGIDLGQMDAKLLKKIEELTLYMIDINKKMETMQGENDRLKLKVEELARNNTHSNSQ